MTMTATKPRSEVFERSFTQFRAKGPSCSDAIVILEFRLTNGKATAQYHVMTCSTNTELDDLTLKLPYMRRLASGRHCAHNGLCNMTATVKEGSVAGQPMLVLRLAKAESLSEPTFDATQEL
jgi:hypothetical protein